MSRRTPQKNKSRGFDSSKRRPYLRLAHVPLLIGACVGLLFLAIPQVALLIRGIATRGWEGLPNAGISEAILLSFFTTACSTLLTLTIGTPLAYVLSRWRFFGWRFVVAIVELPVVLPPTVAGMALLVALGQRGLLGPALSSLGIRLPFTTAAVVIAQTFVSAPFYIRAAQTGFNAVSAEIEDAARVDGASGLGLFRYVTLPLSSTALAAGLTLSWARALGEFGATMLFAGSSSGITRTMPLLVYNIFESNINASIWASVILLGLALVALLISQWLSRRADVRE